MFLRAMPIGTSFDAKTLLHQHGGPASIDQLYMILSRFRAKGYIEKVGKARYKITAKPAPAKRPRKVVYDYENGRIVASSYAESVINGFLADVGIRPDEDVFGPILACCAHTDTSWRRAVALAAAMSIVDGGCSFYQVILRNMQDLRDALKEFPSTIFVNRLLVRKWRLVKETASEDRGELKRLYKNAKAQDWRRYAPGYQASAKASCHKRRANIRAQGMGSFTKDQWTQISAEGRCFDCQRKTRLTVGHLVPIYHRRVNLNTIQNIVPQCAECNRLQGTDIHPEAVRRRLAILEDGKIVPVSPPL